MKISSTFTPLGQLAEQEPQRRQRIRRSLTPWGSLNISWTRPSRRASLPARHVGLATGFGKDRANRLAHPAAHANDELIFQLLDQSRELLHARPWLISYDLAGVENVLGIEGRFDAPRIEDGGPGWFPFPGTAIWPYQCHAHRKGSLPAPAPGRKWRQWPFPPVPILHGCAGP